MDRKKDAPVYHQRCRVEEKRDTTGVMSKLLVPKPFSLFLFILKVGEGVGGMRSL